jgi:hypothetical protein
MGIINVEPAYGRDYKSKADVQAGWEAGHHFFVTDRKGYFSSDYFDKDKHAIYAPDDTVVINYRKGTSWHTISRVRGKS